MTTVLDEVEKSTSGVGEVRILLSDIRWEFYLAFCEEIGERPIRLSYSEGLLEIMITHSPHEFYKTMLAKLIETVILERNLPVRSGGAMTFQRHDLEKGFEPDECWWIEHEAAVRGKKKFDFQHDPPPDLAIEVEMSRSLVNRIGIFAAMGVKEVWRYNGRRLRFCALQGDGSYLEQETSLAHMIDETRRYVTADSLAYLSLEGMKRIVPESGSYCSACFDNNYPIGFPGEHLEQMELMFR